MDGDSFPCSILLKESTLQYMIVKPTVLYSSGHVLWPRSRKLLPLNSHVP